MSDRTVGERSAAQTAAAENWAYLKSQARYWRSWKYTPSSHPRAYTLWVADMRNAWVAYHAGATWMADPDAEKWPRYAGKLFSDFTRAESNVRRLTAEVERLRRVVMRLQTHLPEHVFDSALNLAALAREDGAP